ncbi:MAG: serine hydrolase, partial [Bacteroidota bacterium]
MKTFTVFSIALSLSFALPAQEPLTAEQSNPNQLGWMQGFPPPKNKTISAIDGSFFQFPALRYSVCHMRQFMPTTEVKAARNSLYEFEVVLDNAIDDLTFLPSDTTEPMTWEASLSENYTDGMLILHKGKIVYEKYFGCLKAQGVHAAMSVSKTFTGTLGAMLIEEGALDENKTGSDYVPELKNSAFGDATIRQILDMTTGLKYSEDYADPKAEIWSFSTAGNPFPKPKGYAGPNNYYDYLATVAKEGKHGEVFGYKTINTDA